jgi:prepilin-type N-terminal cleavage/methylation domain-containing protein/prepilin-type processing-associated H-X9-DG protein
MAVDRMKTESVAPLGLSRGTLRAFTLVELLTVVSIIGVLASLLLPALAKAKERTKRVSCGNNLRQLGAGLMLYANDDRRGSLSAKTDSADQNLNWLFPYEQEPRVFTCPATGNFIRTNRETSEITGEDELTDLVNLAYSSGKKAGASYQGFGFTGVGVDVSEEIPVKGRMRQINGIRKNLNNINTYVKFHNAFGLKGLRPGPSKLWIMVDNTYMGLPFYPDAKDNHGASGGNVTFCDGHVEWIPKERYVLSYETSQDENRTGIAMPW